MTDRDDRPQGGRPPGSEEETPAARGETAAPAGPEDDSARSVRELLRGAAQQDEAPVPDVLEGVQRKIRMRSRGKYFDDGWSTARQPPIPTFLVTSLVMLAIVVIIFGVGRLGRLGKDLGEGISAFRRGLKGGEEEGTEEEAAE